MRNFRGCTGRLALAAALAALSWSSAGICAAGAPSAGSVPAVSPTPAAAATATQASAPESPADAGKCKDVTRALLDSLSANPWSCAAGSWWQWLVAHWCGQPATEELFNSTFKQLCQKQGSSSSQRAVEPPPPIQMSCAEAMSSLYDAVAMGVLTCATFPAKGRWWMEYWCGHNASVRESFHQIQEQLCASGNSTTQPTP